MREVGIDGGRSDRLAQIKADLQGSASHYVREENVLFPYLEKHGITQPPAIMWMEHDRIREVKKGLYELIENAAGESQQDDLAQLWQTSVVLSELLHDHFEKENRVLFPTAMRTLDEAEWADARYQFDELGYCPFTPEGARIRFGASVTRAVEEEARGEIAFETGVFSLAELEALLNTLPVEITFVDAKDEVRYFNETETRIFPRTKAAIGRKVQLCHPQKSLARVTRILDDFRSGLRDAAEFWIQMPSAGGEPMFVYIRYYAVRDREGSYLGTLEVVHDVAPIRALEGERRLLDEEE
jgi:DUF438 domain-containing protein